MKIYTLLSAVIFPALSFASSDLREIPIIETATGNKTNIEKIQEKNGKPLMMVVYATWCGPCMEEKPRIDTLAKQMKDVTIIQVSIESGPFSEKAQEIIKYNSANMSAHFSAVPAVIFFDKRGKKIGETHIGAKEWTADQIRKNCGISK